MKIIVLVRAIPDPHRPIHIDAHGRVDVVRWIANPVDEVAVDIAATLPDAEIVAVSTCDEYLLSALARGADHGYLVDAADDRALAKTLVEIAGREQPDLILMGDGECGPRLAGALDISQATGVISLNIVETSLQVSRRLPKAIEVLSLALPAVVTLHASLNFPKLLSLYDIVDTREKKVERLPSIEPSSDITMLSASAAPKARLGRMVNNVDELVHVLREEARVI